MLCIFHAIVQPYHKLIYPLLPDTTSYGKCRLAQCGKLYCTFIYRWLQQQSTQAKMKEEYDKPYRLLLSFLSRSRTKKDLIEQCITAITKKQLHLRTCEHQLVNHIRHNICDCNKVSTASPVKSTNASIKGRMIRGYQSLTQSFSQGGSLG